MSLGFGARGGSALWIHERRLLDNEGRRHVSQVASEFSALPREEMIKDVAISQAVRQAPSERISLPKRRETLEQGGFLLQEDIQLLAYPPAWDDFDDLLSLVPSIYKEVRYESFGCEEAVKVQGCAGWVLVCKVEGLRP